MIAEELEKEITARLAGGGIEFAAFEAKQLLAGLPRYNGLSEKTVCDVREKTERRLKHEPLQYIIGEWEFYGLPFKVGKGVLIPRADSEAVVEKGIKLLNGTERPVVYDLCAGTGCLGIAIAKHTGARAKFIEKSPEAILYLEKNLKLNSITAEIIEYDVLKSPKREHYGTADLIICNPPYIETHILQTLSDEVKNEPVTALDGGTDGLMFYRAVSRLWKPVLRRGGHIVFEIGYNQNSEVRKILDGEGYSDIESDKDYSGNDRTVTACVI